MLLSWYGDRQRSLPHHGPTFGTYQHCSIAFLAGRLRLSRQAGAAAGGRSFLQYHQTPAADQRPDDHSLEAALSAIWTRWPGHLSSRTEGHGADASIARPDSVGHSQETQRRFHPLELSQTGGGSGSEQRRRASGLERSRSQTPPSGALLGQRRSRVRKQGGRHSRPVPESAATRGRLL